MSKFKLKANHLPPQQKPPAPMAETPLLFKAAITALASSYPLSYKENLFKLSYKLSEKEVTSSTKQNMHKLVIVC